MDRRIDLNADILIIGGGSAGCLAAIRAKELNPDLEVVVFEKGDLKRSGSLAMGMDALNIAVVPGVDTAETYLESATVIAQGIMDQKPSYVMAQRSFELMQKLESWGVRFTKDADGNYSMMRIHPKGKFYAAMEEPDLKVILAQRTYASGARVLNRTMATSLLMNGDMVAGATGFNVRTGEFVVCSAKTVILCNGGLARFTLPNSGYLYGVFDFPGNAGDGYAMSFRAGATVTGFEYTMCTPSLKDITCPSFHVTLSRGAKLVNAHGDLVSDAVDVGSYEVLKEIKEGRGPVYIKMDHLPEEKIREIEQLLFSVERPMQKRFFEQRGIDFRLTDLELGPTEYHLCGGHGLTGLVVDENAATTLKGLFAAGDVASVPRQHLTGAFVFGEVAAEKAVERATMRQPNLSAEDVATEHKRVFAPLQDKKSPIGLYEMEYKIRRIAGDYVAPPKNAHKLEQAIRWMEKFRSDSVNVTANNLHELMRVHEIGFIIDCIELSAMAANERKESRWGYFHQRSDYPARNDSEWLKHIDLRKEKGSGRIQVSFRPIERSVV